MLKILFVITTVVLLSSCDDFLTGNIARDIGPPQFEASFIHCSDTAGLNVDDICLTNNTIKILIRNNRQTRIESLIIDFLDSGNSGELRFFNPDELTENSFERQLTLEIGNNRVLEHRLPSIDDKKDNFGLLVLRPTYRAFDGTLLYCRGLGVAREDIRLCGK